MIILTESEQKRADKIEALCLGLRLDVMEHILATGLMAVAEQRGEGSRYFQRGWCVSVFPASHLEHGV